MARVLFLNHTRRGQPRFFDYADIENVRGGERTMLYLAEALAKRDHDVVLACGVRGEQTQRAVTVAAGSEVLARSYDVAISNNYARAFNGVRAPLKLVWTHNPGFSWSHAKADYLHKLRHLPHIVHLSRYTQNRSWFLPRRSQTIIRHGLPAALLAQRSFRDQVPPPIAVFASYAGRNLRSVIQTWQTVVRPQVPDARLIVTAEVEARNLPGIAPSELEKLGIDVRGSIPWSQLMQLLRASRVLIAPGHFQETYNLLTVEAAACGAPTVTRGIGALKERVVHDESGWIAASDEDMGLAMCRILQDDRLWLRYHRACLAHPDLISWDERAIEWERHMTALATQL